MQTHLESSIQVSFPSKLEEGFTREDAPKRVTSKVVKWRWQRWWQNQQQQQ
jgi:hypothetical protein